MSNEQLSSLRRSPPPPPLPAKRDLLRINAQVMRREDATNLWKPFGGTNMCLVSIRPTSRHEYVIVGEVDSKLVLRCPIRKDLKYSKPMPTFHHWCSNKQRLGLTFQSVTDALAFDNCLSKAIDELVDDGPRTDIDDSEFFVAGNLPLGSSKKDSPIRSNTTSNVSSPIRTPSILENPLSSSVSHLERIHYIDRPSSQKGHSISFELDDYSYVHLAPTSCKSSPAITSSTPISVSGATGFALGDCSRRKFHAQTTADFDTNDKLLRNLAGLRCANCNEYLNPAEFSSVCRRHPESNCVRRVTCLACAERLVNRLNLTGWKKWCLMALLTFFLPCICCYPIASLCHRVGRRCGICRKHRHKAQQY